MHRLLTLVLVLGLNLIGSQAQAYYTASYNYNLGQVVLQDRITVWIYPNSDINTVYQKWGTLYVQGSTDYTIENDSCSGTVTAYGSLCAFDVVFSPSSTGIKVASVPMSFTNIWRNPVTGVQSNDYGVVYYNFQGEGIDPDESCTLSVSSDQSELVPDLTPGNLIANVAAQVSCRSNGPTPPQLSGRSVQFMAKMQDGTGGHNHAGESLGIFSSDTCVTNGSGFCSVQYHSPSASGMKDIVASSSFKNGTQTVKTQISVKVANLSNFGSGEFWRLTGTTSAHPDNHYLDRTGTIGAFGLAVEYYESNNATLGYNDMSLTWGGLFDLDAVFLESASASHRLHRTGKSLDIDRCSKSSVANNPNPQGSCQSGFVKVDRRELYRMCVKFKGNLINEQTYHCEFKGN